MREIKFRYIFNKDGFKPLIQILTLEEIEDGKLERIPSWLVIAKNQFTGLKDKNGKEIFEGDIVNFTFTSGEIRPFEIYWQEEAYAFHRRRPGENGWGLDLYSSALNDDGFEVIGNIYENPEALK